MGFNRSASRLRDSTNNMLSAMEHPHVVDEYLAQELALKRMGVVPPVVLSTTQCHISPFGVFPKKFKPGKWRLIMDLSSPQGMSVNDGIDKDTCSLTYVTIDEIVKCMLRLGRGAQLAKIDIKQAYRNLPGTHR